ncbi:hypothetical protein BV22DRAFT_1131430 [Leucogyrophana mollusca]|uniref:Uncharacterized protein n=1 Tax=Leucogyrophana mollusca TaxID=85980 RepID=A0ACB8BAF6_9AGAM|nr:hypothetical protein BV22DRAFT_1131430 [Leucogyrophana mollusca]
MTLSRSQFDEACKDFVEKYHPAAADGLSASKGLTGWLWLEHPSRPQFGYMQRQIPLARHVDHTARAMSSPLDVAEEPSLDSVDNETVTTFSPPSASLVCNQFVVHSPTFQVPTFYFTVHDASGAPLSLPEILQTTLFRPFALHGTEVSAFSASRPSSNFPLLSHGEHPTLGTPCWYFHPCETATAVAEILREVGGDDTGPRRGWIETWFLVLGSVVDLRL